MDEMYAVYQRIIRLSWLIIAVVSSILTLINIIFFGHLDWYHFPLSYLLGAMTNLLAFNLLRNNILKLDDDKHKAVSQSFTNYVLRFIIYGFVLYFSFKNDKLNGFIVFGGFLTVKAAIYLSLLLKNKAEGGNELE